MISKKVSLILIFFLTFFIGILGYFYLNGSFTSLRASLLPFGSPVTDNGFFLSAETFKGDDSSQIMFSIDNTSNLNDYSDIDIIDFKITVGISGTGSLLGNVLSKTDFPILKDPSGERSWRKIVFESCDDTFVSCTQVSFDDYLDEIVHTDGNLYLHYTLAYIDEESNTQVDFDTSILTIPFMTASHTTAHGKTIVFGLNSFVAYSGGNVIGDETFDSGYLAGIDYTLDLIDEVISVTGGECIDPKTLINVSPGGIFTRFSTASISKYINLFVYLTNSSNTFDSLVKLPVVECQGGERNWNQIFP